MTSLEQAVLWGLHQFTWWGVLSTDCNLKITGWNLWLEKHTGLEASAVVGRNLLEVFPELSKRRLDRFYRQAIDGQVVLLSQRLHKYLIQMASADPDSLYREMRQNVHITPLTENDAVVGTLTLIEDVTQRVAYEEELGFRARQQAAVARLGQRALVETDLTALMSKAVQIAVETLGVDHGEILEYIANSRDMRIRAISGWDIGEPGQEIADLQTQYLASHVLRSSEPIIVNELAREARFDIAHLAVEGKISGAAVKVLQGNGAFGILVVYGSDRRPFTEDQMHFLSSVANVVGPALERNRLEIALRERAQQLSDADRRKDEFLAMLGHELRNPLAPISNALRLIQVKVSPDADLEWAKGVIDRQLKYMVRLIDDLLDISRITRGKIQFQRERVELASVIARAVETSRPLIDSRRHAFTLELPPTPVFLEADTTRMAQVLGNLLNNAAKYTPEGGHIWLSAVCEKDTITIRVRDTGVGIPQDMLPRIFDLFTQVNRSLDRSEGGLGIGLTLVRSMVSLHGGDVEAFSEGPGKGSEFVVKLPALPSVPAAPAPTLGPVTEKESAAHRILVVDDNQDSAESLALLLRLSGHEVQTAYDGIKALEAARQFRPRIILMDIGLPGMNGMEVAGKLRQDPHFKKSLLIAMTGYGQEEDRRRSEEVGFDHHLVKPAQPDEIERLIAEFAGSQE